MSEGKVAPAGATDVVLLSDEDATTDVVQRAILGLWESIGELTRLRRTRREHYRVTIFGSARIRPATSAYDQVKHLAARLAALDCEIVTGGGPGLMQAANEGAASVPGGAERSVGIRVELPFEQEVNPFVGQVYEHRTFFSRLHHFMIVSDAFVVVPGGIGTVLELAMACSPQTRRVLISGQSDLSGVNDLKKLAAIQRLLRKPWDPDELKAAIRELLSASGTDR